MLSLDDYVVDVLMRDLVGHDRRPVAFLVYLWLAAEQGREQERREEERRGDDRHKDDAVQISYQVLAESIGVSKSSVQAAVSWLARRKLLAVSKQNATATPRYTVLSPWKDRRGKGR